MLGHWTMQVHKQPSKESGLKTKKKKKIAKPSAPVP